MPSLPLRSSAVRLLSLPLRASALVLSTATLPLAVSLYVIGLSPFPHEIDSCLAAFGLKRSGRVDAAADSVHKRLKASEARLRACEREREACEQALREAQAAHQQGAAASHLRTPIPVRGVASSGVTHATALVCAVAVLAAWEVNHRAVERKVITALLVPAIWAALLRPAGGSNTLAICIHCFVAGWCAHLVVSASL